MTKKLSKSLSVSSRGTSKAVQCLIQCDDTSLVVSAKFTSSTSMDLFQTIRCDTSVTDIPMDDFEILAMRNHIQKSDAYTFDNG